MRVLVTGGNGFIGRRLCPLLRQRGHEVSAAVRSPASAEIVSEYNPTVIGEIGPDTDWDDALRDQEAVIHLAARVHVMEETEEEAEEENFRVNMGGTRQLADAAIRAGIKRFVFLSSVKAGGEESASMPLKEDMPARPGDAYGRSKLAAEQALFGVSEKSALEPVVVRPPLVYGPGATANVRTLFRICEKGIPLPFASVGNRRSLVFVGNLADAIALCLEHPDASRRTFYVRDGEDVSTAELVRRVSSALDRSAKLLPAPVWALRLAARVAGKSQAVDRLTSSLQVDDSEIRTRLGWTPPFNMVQGFAETAAWFMRRNDAR